MIDPEELERLAREDTEVNYKTLNAGEIPPYFQRLQKRLSNLHQILTRDSQKEEESKCVLPFLDIVKSSLECLELKHKVTGEDGIDFPFSINPTNSGFPTIKDLALLGRDKDRAREVLEKELPSRRKLIGMIRSGILGGRPIEHEQILLYRNNYFSKVETADLLPSLSVSSNGPQFCDLQDGKRHYTLEWYCVEGGSNTPVFYKMWFTQDAKFPPLHDENGRKKERHAVLEEFMRESRRGIEDVNEFVTHLDKQIVEIHPKQIKKYTIGPYFDCLTSNSPELENAFEVVKDASALRFTIEMALSVDVVKKGVRGAWNHLLCYARGEKLVNEVYSGIKLMKSGLIVPMRVKQKFSRGYDECKERCEVYGVTEEGEVSL